MEITSIERLFINTMLGWQPPEVFCWQDAWDENSSPSQNGGFLPSISGTQYFKFDLDGDVIRVQAHKQSNGDWTIKSVGVNGDWTHY